MTNKPHGLNPSDLNGPVVDRRTTMKLLGAVGMGALAGCTGGDDGEGTEPATDEETETDIGSSPTPTEAPSADKMGGRLQAGWFESSIDALDPPYISDFDEFPIMANIMNGLVWLAPDLTLRGDLARDWEVTDEGRKFTFDLHEGVMFHNGSEFTADDVRYTIGRTIAEETPAAGKLAALRPVDEGGVTVVDDYTVELNFETAFAPALIYLSRGPGRAATIVSQEAINEMGNEQYSLTPVGTGPFEITQHDPGSRLVLDRFDDYFKTDEEGNQLPYIDGVDIRLIPEPATIVNAIRGGDVDYIHTVPLQNISDIESASDVELLSGPGVHFEGLLMNTEREPFGSTKARLGVARVIDNEEFVDAAYFGNALPDTGVLNKATGWVWREDKPGDQDYNPEEGTRLLEEAGAQDASFSILAEEGGVRQARAMRQQLNRAGLSVEIDQVTGNAYFDRLFGNDFDTTIVGSGGDMDPDQSVYNFFRLPDEDGVWNFGSWRSERAHQLLEDQRRAVDREKRKELLWELEDLVIAEAPFAFLDHQDDVLAKRSNVRGYTHIPGVRYFERIWLDE